MALGKGLRDPKNRMVSSSKGGRSNHKGQEDELRRDGAHGSRTLCGSANLVSPEKAVLQVLHHSAKTGSRYGGLV